MINWTNKYKFGYWNFTVTCNDFNYKFCADLKEPKQNQLIKQLYIPTVLSMDQVERAGDTPISLSIKKSEVIYDIVYFERIVYV